MTRQDHIEAVARAIYGAKWDHFRPEWQAHFDDPEWDKQDRDMAFKQATAAIAVLEKLGAYAGEGWEAVPSEPTEAMVEAARMTLPGPVDICDADIEDIYVTMLAVKPKPAQGKE